MEDKSWIITEIDGTIRVWHPDLEETFFGNGKDIVYEKNDKGEYIQVAVWDGMRTNHPYKQIDVLIKTQSFLQEYLNQQKGFPVLLH